MMAGIAAIASDPIATAEFLAQYLGAEAKDYIYKTDYEQGIILGALAVSMIGTGKKGFLDDIGKMAIRAGHLKQLGNIAGKISAYAWKHADEFGGMFKNEAKMASYIEKVIQSPSKTKYLDGDRVGYYDNATQSVVVVNPKSPDQGTFFRPMKDGIADGEHYFDNELH